MIKGYPDSLVLVCSYCGNRVRHRRVHQYENPLVYEVIDGEEFYVPFLWLSYACDTCGGLSLLGGFNVRGVVDASATHKLTRLHPQGPDIEPPFHMVSPDNPIPEHITKAYKNAWPLRHKLPSASVVQVRKLLERICKEQGAKGRDLFSMLSQLIASGRLPGHLADVTDLIRTVGNLGAHSADEDIDIWDAELMDDFLRFVIEYVYVVPAKVTRMQERARRQKD